LNKFITRVKLQARRFDSACRAETAKAIYKKPALAIVLNRFFCIWRADMESTFKKLATHLTREEKLKYISEKMSEEQRNAMADELTIMDIEYIDALRAATRDDLGETPENKKKANDMTEALLDETLKQIDKK